MKYFLNRLAFLLLALWAAITLNFILPRMMPGNPAEAMLAKFQGTLPPQALTAIEKQLGLTNDPLWKQYIHYLGNLITGNWGTSFQYFPTQVTTIIKDSLPWTLGLLGAATVIAVVVGTLTGILIAWRRGGLADGIIPIVTMFLQSIPPFYLGLILVYFFAFLHRWFPIYHGSSDSVPVGYHWDYFLTIVYHAILPTIVILGTSISGWIIGMRNNMITTLGEDYVVFAEAKGIPKRRLIFSYAARNAILPQLTSLGIALAQIIGGQILIEQVFSYPGIGYSLTNAVSAEDYPLIGSMFLIIAVTGLVINFIVDMLYGQLDPRVRRRGQTA